MEWLAGEVGWGIRNGIYLQKANCISLTDLIQFFFQKPTKKVDDIKWIEEEKRIVGNGKSNIKINC